MPSMLHVLLPFVVSKCPQVHAPANGQITGRRREIGSSVTYSCDEGYDLLGLADTDTRTCQPNEMWTGSEPACEYAQVLVATITIYLSLLRSL